MPAILWSRLGSLVGIDAVGSCAPPIARALGLEGVFPIGSFGAVVLPAVAPVVNNLSRAPGRHDAVSWS